MVDIMTMMNRAMMETTAQQPQRSAADDACCVHCGHPGCDVRVKSCPNRCSYHARCLDLMAVSRQPLVPTTSNISLTDDPTSSLASCSKCPCCSSPSGGLEMLPLSFAEIDAAQRLSGYNKGNGGGDLTFKAPPGKRMHAELLLSSCGDPCASESNFYDPSSPRTGKWSEEEIAFRDEMVPHFVEGSLPLTHGLKLIEFLSGVLKSKPSRLTKKMKHAKLSTRHFHFDTGYIRSAERARELSRLEQCFVNSISDPVERSEIKFHMRREWRDHLAERLTALRIQFDAEEWLRSVDAMDRRITLAKSRSRMVKRRFMMGKAMEKDASSPTPGIFIDQTNNGGRDGDDVDLELLASALEANDAEDADLGALYSGMATASQDGNKVGAAAPAEVSVDGSTRSRFSIVSAASSSSRSASVEPNTAPNTVSAAPFRSALLPALGSAEGPNFRFAAPFLAKITAYVEHNRVPFEHVDIWVPSSSDPVLDPTGATAPEPSLLGSGSSKRRGEEDKGRLCFAGSASVGVQILSGDHNADLPAPRFDCSSKPGFKVVPLTSDEIYHLSLFGSYSEKFSFSSGCGLPGRVFASGVPAWEQFIANAPSHLFERRGGAMQFGITTALGLPIKSPNVGRIVLVLYSKHNREKDDALVARMTRDFCSLNPCPRWKLMVDMGNPPLNSSAKAAQQQTLNWSEGGLMAAMAGLSEKNVQILNLISLLGENMPSEASTQLGQQIHNIMSLRLVLLQRNRSPQDEQITDSIVTLFQSYMQAGRSRPDITLMLARDFEFHSKMQRREQQPPLVAPSQIFQRQMSVPTMQHLSIGPGLPPCQLDHTHHGQPPRKVSAVADGIDKLFSPGSSFQENSLKTLKDGENEATSGGRPLSAASVSSTTEMSHSIPDVQVSPRSSASLNRMDCAEQHAPLDDPPASLPS